MYRIAMEKLLKWKESKRRKPLIIEGARQVGKTWLMKEFGKLYYTDTVYINFDSNSRMAELFASDLDTERLIMGLELYSGRKIDPDHTLLIFDEVQEVPRALSSLKYFYENAPEYHIVCAGSLLGIALHEGTSFPVGKVDFLKLYPLSFKEFLMATGKERFAELRRTRILMRSVRYKRESLPLMSRTFPNTHRMRSSLRSACFGTASPRSWQEKTRSSSMASFEKAQEPRIMKRRFCGFPIADWFIRSAV